MGTLDKVAEWVVEEFNNTMQRSLAPGKPAPTLELPADGRITPS
jgi:hypothetical protein